MSGGTVPLEDFGAPRIGPSPQAASAGAAADAHLEAFDKGYREGWDDAARAHAGEQTTIGADLARALQDMSFTYHEARAAMLGEMRGLLLGLVEKVLPAVARESLGATIRERVEAVAQAQSEVSVEIRVAEGHAARISPHLHTGISMPLRISEEPTLGPGQAVLRFGGAEEMMDLDGVLASINAAVEGFFEGHETGRDEP